jgi:rhombotail lipoprotein
LLINLQKELDLFKEKVKEKPETVVVSHRSGYVGGGAIDKSGLLIAIMIGGLFLCARKSF